MNHRCQWSLNHRHSHQCQWGLPRGIHHLGSNNVIRFSCNNRANTSPAGVTLKGGASTTPTTPTIPQRKSCNKAHAERTDYPRQKTTKSLLIVPAALSFHLYFHLSAPVDTRTSLADMRPPCGHPFPETRHTIDYYLLIFWSTLKIYFEDIFQAHTK